jgi:hypothetical protein
MAFSQTFATTITVDVLTLSKTNEMPKSRTVPDLVVVIERTALEKYQMDRPLLALKPLERRVGLRKAPQILAVE